MVMEEESRDEKSSGSLQTAVRWLAKNSSMSKTQSKAHYATIFVSEHRWTLLTTWCIVLL